MNHLIMLILWRFKRHLSQTKYMDMKFIVSSSQLLKQLQILGGVINTNNTLPILDNFLFELDKKTLTIVASDLETTMISTIEVESDSAGSIAISARLLLDTLKTFPSQPLTFKTNDNNTLEISSEQGKYELAYFSGEEFPAVITPSSLPSLSTYAVLPPFFSR